jgi:hypothetical protein
MRSTVGHSSGGQGLAASASWSDDVDEVEACGAAVATSVGTYVGVATAVGTSVGVRAGTVVAGATVGAGVEVAASSAEDTVVSPKAASVGPGAGVEDASGGCEAAAATSDGVGCVEASGSVVAAAATLLKTLRMACIELVSVVTIREADVWSSSAPAGRNATRAAIPRASPATTRLERAFCATAVVSAPTTRGYYGEANPSREPLNGNEIQEFGRSLSTRW